MHGNHFVPRFMSIHIFAIFRPYTLCAINFPGETLNINLLLCPFFLSLRRFLHLVFGVCVCGSWKPDMDVGSAWMTAEPLYYRTKTDLQHRPGKKGSGKRDRNLQSEHNICVLCMYEPANDITCFFSVVGAVVIGGWCNARLTLCVWTHQPVEKPTCTFRFQNIPNS